MEKINRLDSQFADPDGLADRAQHELEKELVRLERQVHALDLHNRLNRVPPNF